jgi:hypothetical protein
LKHVVSDARLEDFAILDSAFEPPTELDTRHDISVKSDRSPEAVLAETLRALVQRNVAKTE